MKYEIYSETSHRLLFTLFDSSKARKTDMYRVHHHPELELGYICRGEGDYLLENESYTAEPGCMFLIRANEQHCVPTIYTPTFDSFNIYITSYYIWNVCAEYIEPRRLSLLIGQNGSIPHRFAGKHEVFEQIIELAPHNELRFELKRLLLRLILDLTDRFEPTADATSEHGLLLRMNEIQNAILYINENLTEPLTLDQIARQANLSRSHLSTLFRQATGVTPYEYLILQRIEKSVELLRDSKLTILGIAQECGFRNLANFNKTFKKVTGMTPSDYRTSKQK